MDGRHDPPQVVIRPSSSRRRYGKASGPRTGHDVVQVGVREEAAPVAVKPTWAAAPGASVPFHDVLVMVTVDPLVVSVPFQSWPIETPSGNDNVSFQPWIAEAPAVT